MPLLDTLSEPDLLSPEWMSPAPELQLESGDVHIWRARVTADESADFLLDILSRYEGSRPYGLRAVTPRGFQIASADAEGLALLAVAGSGEIGLHLEKVLPDVPVDELAEHYLQPQDHWRVRIARGSLEKAAAFFDCWTREEAMSQIGGDECAPYVHNFQPAEGFTAALALPGQPMAVSFWDWQ